MVRLLLALAAAALLLLLPASAAAQCPVPLPIPQCTEPEPEPTPPPPPPDQPQPPAPPPPPGPMSPVEGSATMRVDPAHTGYFADTSLVSPLASRWRRDFGGYVASALAGDGRIYVSAGGKLRALDPKTGRDLWSVQAGGWARAYDAGRIFVVHGRVLRAHSAADGAVLWSQELSPYYDVTGFPVATGGLVYVTTPSNTAEVLALDAASGRLVWTTEYANAKSTPAVTDDGVFAFAGCGDVRAFNRIDGTPRWKLGAPCDRDHGNEPVVYRGRVYVAGSKKIHDAATGQIVGSYGGGTPMFAGDIGIFEEDSTKLRAVDLDTGRKLWSATVSAGGFLTRSETRVISGTTVYAISDGAVLGFDLRSGTRVWSARVGDTPESHASLAVAPGLLLASGAGRLTAWESFYNPGPKAIEIGPRRGGAVSGTRSFVGGVVGSALRAGTATLEYDEWPFGRWRRDARGTIAADGWIGFRVKVRRNIRFRIRAGGRRSNVATIYAYPRIGYRFRAAGTRVMTIATVRHPRDMRLAGRRAVLYLGRRASRRYQRLGTVALQPAGRAASRASFVHPPPRNVGSRDFVVVCIPGQARLGLGPNVGLTRRCGRRSIRF